MPTAYEARLNALSYDDCLNLGAVLFNDGRAAESIQFLLRAASIRRTQYGCSLLARAYRSLGFLNEALTACELSELHASPDQLPYCRATRAAVLLDFDDYVRAVEAYELIRGSLSDTGAVDCELGVLKRATAILARMTGDLKFDREHRDAAARHKEIAGDDSFSSRQDRTIEYRFLAEDLLELKERCAREDADRSSKFSAGSTSAGRLVRFSPSALGF